MQQTLDDDVPGVCTPIDGELPDAWRYRSDYIWQNTETDELVVISQGTMAEIEDGDGYQVNIHPGDRYGARTVVDNIPLDRAKTVAARYIWRGEVPDDSWLADT